MNVILFDVIANGNALWTWLELVLFLVLILVSASADIITYEVEEVFP